MDCSWGCENPPCLGAILAYLEGGAASVLGNLAPSQANLSLTKQSLSLTFVDDQSPSLLQGVADEYISGLVLKTKSLKLYKTCRPASDTRRASAVHRSPLAILGGGDCG